MVNGIHYDFIEIGTSDFDTLIENSDDTTVGLSIEPISYYLDKLPNKKNVKKIIAGISDEDGFMEIYYIPDERIKENNLKWWFRGSNSIGKPHPFAVKELGEELYNSLVQIDKVQTLSWSSLIKNEKIGSIDYLKIDTEGYDHVILREYLKSCNENPKLYARKIKFERHPEVSNLQEIDEIIKKFEGYYVEYDNTDVILTKFKIPKIIHQTFKSKVLPEELQTSVNQLKEMNPDFEYRFYDDEDCYNFIKENYDEETLMLYESINPNYGSCRADFFRYLLMYKVGGVYLDIKSSTTKPLSQTILPSDEYLLTHWPGKDWSELLNYYHGEFQNWHIICTPNHPFLKKTISDVRNNILNYSGQTGKTSVLHLTGPVAYSKSILKILNKHKTNSVTSPVREFQLESELNLTYMNTTKFHRKIYGENISENEPIILKEKLPTSKKFKKSYVLYADENYYDIVRDCAISIRTFSDLPILIYLIDSDKTIELDNTFTIKWTKKLSKDDEMYFNQGDNFYINRENKNIYQLLIQRPLIIKHALENYSDVVAYVDSDSIASKHCDRIFDMYDPTLEYPYFVEGIYDYLHLNGRGGADSRDDLSTTLEHPACELFGVNQYVRERYRQTGYFVAGKYTIDFLEEWYEMCSNEEVQKNPSLYAPYNEETILNVLLWKYNIQDGLPYIYVNGNAQTLDRIFYKEKFTGYSRHLGPWLRLPAKEEDLLFVHGEKRNWVRREILERLKIRNSNLKTYPNVDPTKNWGDIISKFLLEHFSGKELKKEDVFYFDDSGYMLEKNGKILGVGSSMKYSRSKDYIWGTGCIDTTNIGDKPKKVYSVRGPLSRNELLKRGWDVPEIFGDPALLFPKIYNPKIEKKYKYGLIPHCVEFHSYEGLKIINHFESLGVKIIDITSGIYEFIDQILECENILSSSLHGLIASDAYGIANHRVVISDLIHGGDFKYLDYFESVKRKNIKPTFLNLDFDINNIHELDFEIGDTSITDKILSNTPWEDGDCIFFKTNNLKTLRVLFLAPHLSTGGMPGFLLKRIQTLKEFYPDVEIYVVEHGYYGDAYVVQRNQILELVGKDKFWSLGDEKMKLIDILKENKIDIVHVDEMIEGFDSFNRVSNELMKELYCDDRTWKMVETCHNVVFNPIVSKKYHPDAYAFCTPYHKEVTFKDMPSYGEVFEFPIDNNLRNEEEQKLCQKELGLDLNKKHVVNVGLWTSGKNQGEAIQIAKNLISENIEFHFVGNQAGNFKEYWEPLMKDLPPNVRVWGERSDVSKFMKAADVFMFNSTFECNPLVLREAASYGLKILARNLPQYMGMFDEYIFNLTDDLNTNIQTLKKVLSDDNFKYEIVDGHSERFAKQHYEFYKQLKNKEVKKDCKIMQKPNIVQYFINQPFLEITGDVDSTFEIKFYDEQDKEIYQNFIKSNHWVKLNRQYFTRWKTKVWQDGTLIYDQILNFEGKRVFINFDSKSLGDNIAWVPYARVFQEKHNCKVVISTFWNKLFKNTYPELEFVEPGMTVHNIVAQYTIGWFYDENKEPEIPNTIPLQKAATNILGLEFKEIKPRVNYLIKERPYEEKYITIATNSTSGCKFWTREGWQELINHLTNLGYKVVNVSKEENPFENQIRIKDTSIENTMNVIHHSEFFIGLSSGLSWLAWGMGKKVVMISNFTESDHEFTMDCIRITNPDVCNSCWNNPDLRFDRGDWNWCPFHKGTSRQFECHTSITSQMVIDKIKNLL